MDRDTDFVAHLGRAMTAHRLRRLAEMLVDGYGRWLRDAGVTIPARALSTMRLLEEAGPLGVTEIAARLRLSHPFMINLVGTLEQGGFVAISTDARDARRRPVTLTRKGRREAARVRRVLRRLDAAFADLFAEIGVDLLEAVGRAEDACLREPFHRRLQRAVETSRTEEELICD